MDRFSPEELGVKVYDWALPQDWVNDFRDKTGFEPFAQFVWSYDEARTWGAPVPLSIEAEEALVAYGHLA